MLQNGLSHSFKLHSASTAVNMATTLQTANETPDAENVQGRTRVMSGMNRLQIGIPTPGRFLRSIIFKIGSEARINIFYLFDKYGYVFSIRISDENNSVCVKPDQEAVF